MRQKIEATQAWQNLSEIQKSIYQKRTVMLDIQNQFLVATHKGEKLWLEDHKPDRIRKAIILELLETEKT